MKKEFKTGVDPFFIIWPILILVVQTCFYVFSISISNVIYPLLFATIVLLITTFLLSVATTKYVISEEDLLIKNMINSICLPLSEINHWEFCESGIGIYAASTKQIELETDKKKIRISPARREEFTEMLEFYKEMVMV